MHSDRSVLFSSGVHKSGADSLFPFHPVSKKTHRPPHSAHDWANPDWHRALLAVFASFWIILLTAVLGWASLGGPWLAGLAAGDPSPERQLRQEEMWDLKLLLRPDGGDAPDTDRRPSEDARRLASELTRRDAVARP